MPTALAKAYVQIVPSAEGFSNAISQEINGDGAGEAAGSSFGSSFSSALKNVVGAAAIGTAIKTAVSEGAALEQTLGGVETLFKDSAAKVVTNAEQAYKTAGLSANEYMETVTGFSASLLQSMGGNTEAAADTADMALQDMSDNANKFGTDMESIQYAYQGFAKQNYTMLDNLKLGYGGTKDEMARLLADAKELTGVEYDISSLSDVYNAIHAIQDDLEITGTTAKESSETFAGSMAAMLAAGKNLLGNLALGKDITPSLEALGETVTTFISNNLIPMIANLAVGLAKAAPKIIVSLAKALIDNIPTLLDAAWQIGLALIEGIWDGISGAASWLWDKIKGWASNLMSGIKSFFGIESPSKLMRDEVGVMMAKGVGVGFESGMAQVNRDIESTLNKQYKVDLATELATTVAKSSATQDSSTALTERPGNNVFYITIPAKDIKEFMDIVRIAQSAPVTVRMGSET